MPTYRITIEVSESSNPPPPFEMDLDKSSPVRDVIAMLVKRFGLNPSIRYRLFGGDKHVRIVLSSEQKLWQTRVAGGGELFLVQEGTLPQTQQVPCVVERPSPPSTPIPPPTIPAHRPPRITPPGSLPAADNGAMPSDSPTAPVGWTPIPPVKPPVARTGHIIPPPRSIPPSGGVAHHPVPPMPPDEDLPLDKPHTRRKRPSFWITIVPGVIGVGGLLLVLSTVVFLVLNASPEENGTGGYGNMGNTPSPSAPPRSPQEPAPDAVPPVSPVGGGGGISGLAATSTLAPTFTPAPTNTAAPVPTPAPQQTIAHPPSEPTSQPASTSTPTERPTIPPPPPPEPELALVPNVVGMEVDAARWAVRNRDLEVADRVVTWGCNGTMYQIVGQNPRAGNRINPGSVVTIDYCKEVVVPNVIGMHRRDAIATIEERGLWVAEVREVDGDKPEGLVRASEPGPGSAVAPESIITIYSYTHER